MIASDVADYYDELHRWTANEIGFRAFSGFEADSIHRFLIDEATAAFSPETIHKFIDPHVAEVGTPRGLDAGCGYGGTVFRCIDRHRGRWTGITISPEQVRHARDIANARGIGSIASFHLLSFDAPLPDRFNVITAIESLIHSADPAATVANLAASLDSGGRLIVVDDMPLDEVPKRDNDLFSGFKSAWRCPVAPSAAEWRAIAGRHRLRCVSCTDLSHLLRPRAESELDAALVDLISHRASRVERGFGRLSDAEIGGLHLERLLRRGTIRYVMLVFEKL